MRKSLIGGIVALALILAPAAAASAVDYPPIVEGGKVSATVVKPGDTITYTGPAGLFQPNEAVTESIRGISGAKVTLAASVSAATWNKAAAADGSLTFNFTMPMDGDKDYVLTVKSAVSNVNEQFTITVIPDAAPITDDSKKSGANGLASTGSNTATAIGIGVGAAVVAALGVILLLVRRRRAAAVTAAS